MLKYTDTQVGFREVPDKIALLINISGCKIHCPSCHSKYLWEDIGDPLTTQTLDKLIKDNDGINCVCFMGGEDFDAIAELASHVNKNYSLSVAWYIGHDLIDLPWHTINQVDFLKVGPYKEECGPLDKETTNQRLYVVSHVKGLKLDPEDGTLSMPTPKLTDITYKFWAKQSHQEQQRHHPGQSVDLAEFQSELAE